MFEHLKSRIKSYLAPSPRFYSNTTLPGLPPELLLLIGGSLPSLDLICLSLCNHRIYELLRRYFQLRPSIEDEKTSIAIRLGQDYPEYFSCTICKILHRYDGSESFGLSGPASTITCRLPCVQRGIYREKEPGLKLLLSTKKEHWLSPSSTLRTHRHRDYTLDDLSFLRLKLAMRRFYYGSKFGISTESLSYTQVHYFPRRLFGEEITSLFSREAQICPEPLGLCVRTQDIVICHSWINMFFDRRLQVYDTCIHNDPIEKLSSLPGRLYHQRKVSLSHVCERCNTASLIELTFSAHDVTFMMTRWVNLGPGLNPEDPRWKIHVNSTSSRPAELPSSLRAQNPRSCFESMARRSYEDLLSRNSSYLRDQQYKNGEPFIATGQGLWYIPHKDP